MALPVEKKLPVLLSGNISAKNRNIKGVIKWKLFKCEFLKYFVINVLTNTK